MHARVVVWRLHVRADRVDTVRFQVCVTAAKFSDDLVKHEIALAQCLHLLQNVQSERPWINDSQLALWFYDQTVLWFYDQNTLVD